MVAAKGDVAYRQQQRLNFAHFAWQSNCSDAAVVYVVQQQQLLLLLRPLYVVVAGEFVAADAVAAGAVVGCRPVRVRCTWSC